MWKYSNLVKIVLKISNEQVKSILSILVISLDDPSDHHLIIIKILKCELINFFNNTYMSCETPFYKYVYFQKSNLAEGSSNRL